MTLALNTINIVLDIETLGTAEDAAIIQIGAVVPLFDRGFITPGVSHEFDCTARYENCLRLVGQGVLSMDDSTMNWWQNQPTRTEVFSGQVTYIDMLIAFKEWVKRLGDDEMKVCVWGNGSDFDNKILTHSLDAHGIHDAWSFRNNRCFRTLKALYPVPDSVAKMSHEGEIKHTGIGDARYEARLMDWIRTTYGAYL